jgi:hypothetical protein
LLTLLRLLLSPERTLFAPLMADLIPAILFYWAEIFSASDC